MSGAGATGRHGMTIPTKQVHIPERKPWGGTELGASSPTRRSGSAHLQLLANRQVGSVGLAGPRTDFLRARGGARLIDVDEKVFLDFGGGSLPERWALHPPRVLNACASKWKNTNRCSWLHPRALRELARKLCEISPIPGARKRRFQQAVPSGREAVRCAQRRLGGGPASTAFTAVRCGPRSPARPHTSRLRPFVRRCTLPDPGPSHRSRKYQPPCVEREIADLHRCLKSHVSPDSLAWSASGAGRGGFLCAGRVSADLSAVLQGTRHLMVATKSRRFDERRMFACEWRPRTRQVCLPVPLERVPCRPSWDAPRSWTPQPGGSRDVRRKPGCRAPPRSALSKRGPRSPRPCGTLGDKVAAFLRFGARFVVGEARGAERARHRARARP